MPRPKSQTIPQILTEIRDLHLPKPEPLLPPTTKKNKAANQAITRRNSELPEFNNNCCVLFTKWLERGDGIAVYENQAFDSSNCGHKKFCSYGSPAAQIEAVEPPQTMPDIGAINWMYQLSATYKLEQPTSATTEEIVTNAD